MTTASAPTAFVLGGDGVRGAVQIGMLRAWLERGITPDLVVGTSIGAINGAGLAADPTPAVVPRSSPPGPRPRPRRSTARRGTGRCTASGAPTVPSGDRDPAP
ncbi:patatin-like phospholipase family protein [Cellulosimicrobium cellulans]|uniref:patatin-like phospholipase family protein n=1 Tax=Cellulosimicrobium cellulans TaxID=1710 RepID=UPI0024071A09|nr:patatin-like phospholipase family protein [Cellulosimicrobium cellulans]MDF9875081.1 hypothetical protein [Cellulosimicrobium cellulans]